jgi:hypothetical protein
MDRLLTLLHLVGMALFLGSIAVYIALSPWAKSGGLDRRLLARQVIALGTTSVTLMALAAAAVGVWKPRWPRYRAARREARRGSPDQDVGRRLLGGVRMNSCRGRCP